MSSRTVQTSVAVAAAIAVVALFFFYGNVAMNMGSQGGALGAQEPGPQGLVVQDEMVGSGDEATLGKKVTVHYTGRFADGRVFDTSVGKPASPGCSEGFCFTLGEGSVIAGWDQGLQGMKVGGKRLLVVPPELGYGPQGYGPIPGNATLIFEVELLGVE